MFSICPRFFKEFLGKMENFTKKNYKYPKFPEENAWTND